MSGLKIFLTLFLITFILLFSINIILYYRESSYFKSSLIFSVVILLIILFFLFVIIFIGCIPKKESKQCRSENTVLRAPLKVSETVTSCNSSAEKVDSQMTINQVQNIKNKIENIKTRIENEKDLDKILNLIDNSNKSLEKLIKINIKDPILKKDIDKFIKRMSDFNIKMI